MTHSTLSMAVISQGRVPVSAGNLEWITTRVTSYGGTGLSYTMNGTGFTLGFLSPSDSPPGKKFKIFLGSLYGFSDCTMHDFVTSEEK